MILDLDTHPKKIFFKLSEWTLKSGNNSTSNPILFFMTCSPHRNLPTPPGWPLPNKKLHSVSLYRKPSPTRVESQNMHLYRFLWNAISDAIWRMYVVHLTVSDRSYSHNTQRAPRYTSTFPILTTRTPSNSRYQSGQIFKMARAKSGQNACE